MLEIFKSVIILLVFQETLNLLRFTTVLCEMREMSALLLLTVTARCKALTTAAAVGRVEGWDAVT